MPQMAPMWWTTIMYMSSMMMMLTIIMSYFSIKNSLTKSNKKVTKNLYWKW